MFCNSILCFNKTLNLITVPRSQQFRLLMMAGSVDDIGGETQLCSHQDVVDCGGAKFDCNGNGNVSRDLGASYVFVSGVGDVNGCGASGDENCDVKGNGVVGDDQDSAVGIDKEVDLNGEFDGEVVENVVSEGTGEDRVEGERGEDLESWTGSGEGMGEDRFEGETGEDLESRTGSVLELGVREGTVIELSDKSGEDVEENVVVSMTEVGEGEQSGLGDGECELVKVEAEVGEEEAQERTELQSVEGDLEVKDQGSFRQMKDLGSDAEFGESQEGVIRLADSGEFDKSVKAVEQDHGVPPGDFEEGNQSNTVALGDDICELAEIHSGIEVDVGEGKLKDQTELNSVEETLESDRTTESVDCESHDLEENQYKFEHRTDLDSKIDGGVQMGNEIIAVADEGIICMAAANDFKDLDKGIDGSQSVDKLDLTPSDAATCCSMDKVPIECGENITAGTDDCAAVENEASKSLLVKGIDAELDSNENQTYEELIEHVPAKIFGSVLASIDNGTVSDQGPADADCRVGQVQGYEAERVALDTDGAPTTEIATRSVTDQSEISQINLGEQGSGFTKSPELNGNPDNEAIECGENITTGTDNCAAMEHEVSKSVLVQGIGAVNSTELDSNKNQTYAEMIEHVPAKIFGSVLASIDNGTVSDQGPADADCGVGQVQGYEAERVAPDTDGALTTETATRSVTDQSKISQINLGEQGSGCTKSPELNGNPDNEAIECGENITTGTDDCAAMEHEVSKSVLVQGIGAVNSTELDSNKNQTYAELIEHVPAKIFGSVLASIDNGTVSDQGPADADCGVGQVQGFEAERVAPDTDGALTTETATRPVTDQSKISQINLGEQRSGCTKSPELNGNPDNEAIECGGNITTGTDDCAAMEHEVSKNDLVLGIGAVNSTELDSNKNQTYAELIEHVPGKIFGSVLASIDNGTVSDQGPADADCGVGQVQGYDAERVALVTDGIPTTETATRSVTDQSKISQVNLGEQRSGYTKSPELNGNPENEAIECGENMTAGTDDCAAVEHEAFKSVLVQGIGAVNSTELDSNINQKYADCGVGQVQGYDTERVALDTDGTLTTESATKSVTDQSQISQINLGEQRSDCTKSPELNGIPDNAHFDCIVPQVQSDEISRSDSNGATILEPEVRNLVCPVTDGKPEMETKHFYTEDVKSGIFSVTDGTESEVGVANGLSSCAPDDVRFETKIEFGTIDSAEIVSKSRGQVLNGDVDCKRNQAIFPANLVESEGCADMQGKEATVAECSIGHSVDGQSIGNVAKAKPFQFLAKFPRIDDDKLREQIRNAQLLVEEKTVLRHNIRCEIDIKRANLQSLGDEFEATKSDERAARRLVKLKRQEIDSVQDKINRVKNSVSVMDITNRIAHMEHMIEHETHPLKEEMQLLREINVLKKLRGQISSNVCSTEEVTQALSQLEPTEMQLKTLKKELGDLKDKVSKAEAAVILLGKKYNDETKKLRELQARFRAANDIRQDAYKNLLGLKRQLHEKGKHFWIYKDDAKAASDFALNGDKEALYHLCAKQVDTFMDLWNKNDEFREDYVRCNMKSTLRRFKTLDGRSLGPDEEVHVFPVYVGERESRQLNNPSTTANPSSPTILKQENTVQSVEREPVDDKFLVMAEPKSKMFKNKTSVNPIPESGLLIGFRQLEVEETKEEEKQQTKEELELARKDEMLRKEEIDAKLKEQLRQEEKAKAQEALERKKRNADKAQMRAVLRAQKEAEQKEKEREKRMRKKEKKEKKTTDGENSLELQTTHIKDDSKENSPTTKPSKTSHFNRYNKTKATIPPALRNRGKRRLKQIMWWIFGGLMIVLLIFLVVNAGASKNLRPRKDDSFSGNHQSGQPVWQS
ncbi:hypothetical protein POM88_010142 [Heracleum sosnowskyi]|uniref:Proton pump-interactor 1 n=1 Tax=Heracleum sosnowskyi TaxID=360622 RepID=A0AAD8N866_9APIA|nr:hypothetical protein POM88_010142 [Heracleum sosnowskyi]